MKFWEAMKALEEGHKVHCKDWSFGSFIDRKGDDSRIENPYLEWVPCIDKEWELYDEPEKTYSFEGILHGLKEGKSFRRKCWIGDEAIVYADRAGNIHFLEDGKLPYTWTIRDVEATDWIEVK